MQIAKYSASGNDFIIFHTFLKKDRSALAKELCNRFSGIGADGLIALLPHNSCDVEWEFYNSDGSIASMCGNGTRAAGHYAYTNELAPKNMKLLSGAGEINIEVDGVSVKTEFSRSKIINEGIKEGGEIIDIIDTGVPHVVVFTNDLDNFDINRCRELREKYNANVNYAKIIKDEIFVRTYERGVENETMACGTGMGAVFLSANLKNLTANSAIIIPKSQEKLEFSKIDNRLFFKGRVKKVFETTIDI